ncbi:MAG: hypothetical protein J7576_09555 [Siphonobacter aquaeclarae]|nr:hypothetical protein [Siphonobacter aquaeclarae]
MSDNKSLGKRILGIFFEDATGDTPSPAASPATAPAPGGAPAQAAPAPAGSPDSKFVDHFASVLEKNNLPGQDYFEFRATLKSLGSIGLSEGQQFQAAWASFRALAANTSLEQLKSTAEQYLTILKTDRDAFLKSVDIAVQEKVGSLQNEQKTLEKQAESLTKQIADLQAQIEAGKERLAKINGEIEEQSGKITQNRANYEATFAAFTSQIKEDIDKITQYLRS